MYVDSDNTIVVVPSDVLVGRDESDVSQDHDQIRSYDCDVQMYVDVAT